MAACRGFTLLEIAIVLVIIGVLFAGILKGNELIVSARVLDVATQQEQVRTAYLAFFDRFRSLPGDYPFATNTIPGVTGCGGNGNGNGRIEGTASNPPSIEYILAWEHLSKAGFLAGSYTCDVTDTPHTTPINPFGSYLQIAWDSSYASAPGPRHSLKTGNQIPSNILAELDRKVDDGSATSGSFRFSNYDAGTGVPNPQNCYDPSGKNEWKMGTPGTNCGGATLF